MKRHAFDLTSFVFGVVLATAAAGFLLADQLAWDVDGRWVLPIALILLGVAGVAGALSGIRQGRSVDEGTEEADDEGADGVPEGADEPAYSAEPDSPTSESTHGEVSSR